MLVEHSYGIVPLRKVAGQWQVLIVQHHAGHWGFPKGHAQKEEGPWQAAQRELAEETGLCLTHLLQKKPFIEDYYYTKESKRVHKSVEYYAALVEGVLLPQASELQQAQWCALRQAEQRLTYLESRRILQQVAALLSNTDPCK